MRSVLVALGFCALSWGCGDDRQRPAVDAALGGEAGACFQIGNFPVADAQWVHVAVGSAITWAHNPPTGGAHYPIWAAYRAYTTAVPRGYWVHNLEHGGIVLVYRPDAPAALAAQLGDAYQMIQNDPYCASAGLLTKRALLTPDPDLADPIAVAAANWALQGTCVDASAILGFVAAHRNMARENICDDGAYP
jgi:hypothetical protein